MVLENNQKNWISLTKKNGENVKCKIMVLNLQASNQLWQNLGYFAFLIETKTMWIESQEF